MSDYKFVQPGVHNLILEISFDNNMRLDENVVELKRLHDELVEKLLPDTVDKLNRADAAELYTLASGEYYEQLALLGKMGILESESRIIDNVMGFGED